MAEMDALNELYDSLESYYNFQFLSATFDTPDKIARVRYKYNIRYPISYIKERSLLETMMYRNGFPTSVVIGRDGIIKQWKTGGSLDKKLAREAVMDELYSIILKELGK